jgi:hypothetical protein
VVPRLVMFSGIVTDAEGKPGQGAVPLTFSLYDVQEGGAPLWSELQSPVLDAHGQYTAFLGASSLSGLPLDLFASGAARWLSVRPELPGAAEQPRVLLVGVPYALKAADADTLGGKPASAFALAMPTANPAALTASEAESTPLISSGTPASSTDLSQTRRASAHAQSNTACASVTSDGTAAANQVTKFTTPCNIENSAIVETSGRVGIGETTPYTALHIRKDAAGQLGPTLLLMNGAGSAGAGASVDFDGYDPGPLGYPAARIQSLDDGNSSAHLTFLAKTPGSPYNTLVERMRITDAGSVGVGTASPSALLEVNGNVKFDGNLALPATTATAGAITLGGQPFLSDFGGSTNTFVGVAGNVNSTNTAIANTAIGNQALAKITTGNNNTAIGYTVLAANTTGCCNSAVGDSALFSNTVGADNTAQGVSALAGNTIGAFNTAIGTVALQRNSTGSGNTALGVGAGNTGSFPNISGNYNTFLGYYAGTGTEIQLTNATAIGANAQVSENNALVLGANGVKVGIGISSPAALLDIEGSAAPTGAASVSALNVVGGTGGSSSSIPGQGANVTIQAGAGGVNSGGGTGGNGGNITIQAGSGGNSRGTGGSITLQPGAGGPNEEIPGNPGFLLLAPNGSNVGIGTASPAATLHVNGGGEDILLGQNDGANVFRVDDTGKAFFDGGTQTGGADFAESVAVRGARSLYEPGDVLAIDPNGHRRLTLARTPYSSHVAGIYSTKPGVLATPHSMDDAHLEDEVPLAIVGIVPCKVTAKNGPIQVGDMLVSSSLPGYAMKGTARGKLVGAVVGKALEPLRVGNGVIQVLVTLQ